MPDKASLRLELPPEDHSLWKPEPMHFDIWRLPGSNDLQVVEASVHCFCTPAHLHSCLELVWLLSGTTEVCCRSEKRIVDTGYAFAIAPNEIHSNRFISEAGGSYQAIQIPVAALLQLDTGREMKLMELLRSEPLHVFSPHTAQHYLPALTEALKYWHLDGSIRNEAGTLLAGLLHEGRSALSTRRVRLTSLHPAVAKARAILESNCGERIGLVELARAVNLNQRYLLALFKSSAGISPCQLQLGARADRARNLIVADLPLVEVAAHAGFSDQSHLVRDFKKFHGITPGEFRKACTLHAAL